MAEHERIVDAFRNCITEPKCKDCPWVECDTLNNGVVEIPKDLALAVMRMIYALNRDMENVRSCKVCKFASYELCDPDAEEQTEAWSRWFVCYHGDEDKSCWEWRGLQDVDGK